MSEDKIFKGWYSRGYLPHYDQYGLLQSVTFRLDDSLPKERLLILKEELEQVPLDKQDFVRRERLDEWMDAGFGCCGLKYPEMASIMQSSLLRFDGEKYRLIAWCIMPNHVHVLIEPLIEISKIVQSWKSYTGKWAIKNGFNSVKDKMRRNPPRSQASKFWMSGYWDRYIRDEKHFYGVIEYIHNNPVKAKLCKEAMDWKWSSVKGFNLGARSIAPHDLFEKKV